VSSEHASVMGRGATHARSPRAQIAAVEGRPSRVDAMDTGGQPSATPMCSGTTTKRVIDVTLAAAGLLLTAPLMIGLGVLVSLDSPGPALFLQRRPGRSRVPFTMVKLRTMDAQGRITSAGRFLRPMGLDELPQLWNVLKGDMSLIGPRPEVLERVERYEREIPGYRDRYQIRPGITGWAQVNGLRGDSKVSIAERLRFDIQYLREWSPALDGRILLRTVSTVLRDTLRSFRE
jgi:putative colanic acid biosysnthesis UDP-glucose lipid carrier transferase